jgi:hypothetical protein
MFEINDLLSFNIGFFTGVFGSYLIYITYSIIGNYAAKKKLDMFFKRFGVLKGIAFYEKMAETCDDDGYKSKITQMTQEYIDFAKKHEKNMDETISEYVLTTQRGDNGGNKR